MVIHGTPILVCENINLAPAVAPHHLYTVYPPTTPHAGVAYALEDHDRDK